MPESRDGVKRFEARFRLISAEGDIAKLMKFQDKMRKVGFAPNQLTCKYVIDGLQKAVRVHKINI